MRAERGSARCGPKRKGTVLWAGRTGRTKERGGWGGKERGIDGDQVIWRKRAGGGMDGWMEGAEARGEAGGEDERCERHGSSASSLWLARDCRIS